MSFNIATGGLTGGTNIGTGEKIVIFLNIMRGNLAPFAADCYSETMQVVAAPIQLKKLQTPFEHEKNSHSRRYSRRF